MLNLPEHSSSDMAGTVDLAGRDYLSIVTNVMDHPWLTLLFMFATICAITRTRTGWNVNLKEADEKSATRTVPMVPYWIPWIGHTVSYVLSAQDYLKSVDERVNGGIFALRIAGGTHNFVTSPSLVNQIFNRPGLPTSTEEFVYFVMTSAFGDHGSIRKLCSTADGHEYIWSGAHKALFGMLREPFLSRASSGTMRAVGDQAWNLVSGNTSWVDQAPWERTSRVDVMSVYRGGGFVAEADLYVLLRDWISDIASTIILGHSFMENNPNTVSDLWLMDSKFTAFLTGLPYWLIPGLAPAHAARERIIESIREHHEAMIKVLDGKDPGTRYDDLSDVPPFIWERVEVLKKCGASPRCYAASDFTILWAMNINANQVIFWVIFYLFSHPETLAAVRKETTPFVKIRKTKPTGLPIPESPKLDFDLQGLLQKSPLLRGAMHEAMRLEVAGTPYKSATQDFTITESAEDARLAGKQRPETYLLKKGDMICLPGKVHQDSATYFPNPERFDAKRFWTTDKKGETDRDVTLDYQTMRLWGGGKTMCKGRKFAEREVLIFVAAIIMCWDMEPVDKANVMSDGRWKHPGRKIVTGTAMPKKDIRVKMSRRTPW